jgi:acetoacetyl-CoA synthetase
VSRPLWSPSAERIESRHLTRFAEMAHARYGAPGATGNPAGSWAALWRWSIDERAAFWTAVFEYAAVRADRGITPALERSDEMPGARWFPHMHLNFAENLLERRDGHLALVFVNEEGQRRELSYGALYTAVEQVAGGLASTGVGPGDVVAGFLPNLPEAVIAMLATASLGAVWTSCSPDFGINGVLDRFGQVRPKVLFTVDGYACAGKRINSLIPIAGVLQKLESVERTIVVPHLSARPDITSVPNAIRLEDFVCDRPLEFVRQPFDAPLFIMYSSGTTGVPKCIVHGAGGTLLQHRKEHLLHADLGRTTGCSSLRPVAG